MRTTLRAALIPFVAAALITAPEVHAADVRIGINGARPSTWPILSDVLGGSGFTQERWLAFAPRVGQNWLPGTDAVALDYPAQLGPLWGPAALSGDDSVAIGQQRLHESIMAEVAAGNTVAVAGLSMGTLVIDKELAYLAEDPNAPPADAVTFYVFGGESRGFGETYAPGVTVPFFGMTFDPVPETKYDVVVVGAQWDGWANPPDRPWHVLPVLNAAMGALLTINGANDHSEASLAHVTDAVLVSETTNSLGGTTSTYIIPNADLPLTRPLRELGVDDAFVDKLNSALMPVIEAGYSTMTPHLGPHVERGRLVWKTPQPAAEPAAIGVRHHVVEGESGRRTSEAVAGAVDAVNPPTVEGGVTSHTGTSGQASTAEGSESEAPKSPKSRDQNDKPRSVHLSRPSRRASLGEQSRPVRGDRVLRHRDTADPRSSRHGPIARLDANHTRLRADTKELHRNRIRATQPPADRASSNSGRSERVPATHERT